MNANQTRQYEMLLRVRDFSKTHGDLFVSPTAQEAFAAINSAVDELTATAQMKLSALQASRADRKRKTRKALIELLVNVGQLARVMRARGQAAPLFRQLESKSAHVLLTTARQFAHDVAPFEAEFSGHGLGAAVINETAAVFEAAVRNREVKRADHMEARVRIRGLLASALLDARRLDLIVRRTLGEDENPVRAVWKQARHVERRRGARAASAATVLDISSRAA